MKLRPALATALFAIVAGYSFNIRAAADNPGDAKAAVEKAAPQKKVQHHSHLQEKTGFQPGDAKPVPAKADTANDRTKHFHHRDGK